MNTLKSKWVITRKMHTCFGCCNRHPIGSNMHYFAGVVDGDFSTSYTCQLCSIIINNNPIVFDDGFFEGAVIDFWNEYPGEYRIARKELDSKAANDV